MEDKLAIFITFANSYTFDPAFLLLGIVPKDTLTHVQNNVNLLKLQVIQHYLLSHKICYNLNVYH